MWETLMKYKHENYEIHDAREGVLNHKRLNFFNNLKEERSKYDTYIYMVNGTESQSELSLGKQTDGSESQPLQLNKPTHLVI